MIRVVLQCDDAYFVRAFGNYASAHCANIEFICFTKAEKALAYISSTSMRVDAVFAEHAVIDRLSVTRITPILIAEQTQFSDGHTIRINIYQSGPAIISDIRSALAISGNHILTNAVDREVKIVAAYSVQGGSGKTVLSYALAAAAARSGRQALYLNLEPFPALGQLYDHTFSSTMDNLLFGLKGGRELAPVVLDTMERNSDNVFVLPPFSLAGDLLTLTQDDLRSLFKVLVEKTDLEYIFVDLPVGLQEMNLWALEVCTSVIMIYSDDLVGREHMQRAQSDVYFKNLPIEGGFLTVLNKSQQKEREEGIAARIPQSESLLQGRRVSDVQERNPAFYKSCVELLHQIG